MHVDTERTYTLADLDYWPLCLENWPSDGIALAVLGSPIDHSLSPVMHNAALAELAEGNPKFAKWRYFKFKIDPTELEVALKIFHRKKFLGLNLTVPHKTLVMQYLNLGLQHQFLHEMGAANTLKYKEDGWYGYNTDGVGLVGALKHDLAINLKDQHIILLGAGGAARAAAVMCMKECASLWIGNRTKTNRDELIKYLKKSTALINNENLILQGFDPAFPPLELPDSAIVINATSLGLKAEDDTPLDLTTLTKTQQPIAVFDMIYRPAQTALLRQAKERNISHANGLSMLVYQGVSSLKHWIGEANLDDGIINIMHQAVGNA